MTMDQEYVDSLWQRAVVTLEGASANIDRFPDIAANRSYYSVFYAVSAFFASEGRFFKKHTGLRSVVHKELVHTGRWEKVLGDDYDKLMELREVADYGVLQEVSKEDAMRAIERANGILFAVHEMRKDIFPL